MNVYGMLDLIDRGDRRAPIAQRILEAAECGDGDDAILIKLPADQAPRVLEALLDPSHYVRFNRGGWSIEHPFSERAAGTGSCALNAWMRTHITRDRGHRGRYKATPDDQGGYNLARTSA